MRYFATLIAGLVCAASLPAQTGAYEAVVRQPAEVRGGRSTTYPVTSKLPAGTRVRVIREEQGWLAIAPPEGSSSWVMDRLLDSSPDVGQRTLCRIKGDDGPVMLGSPDQPKPLPNQVGTLKEGTLVEVLGEKAVSDVLGDRTTWWRIRPNANEVRWVSKEVLSTSTPVTVPTPNAVAARPGQPLPELWTRAEQAERAGNYSLAAVYYRQLATEQSRPGGDYNLANQASARADYLNRRGVTTAARPVTGQAAPTPPPVGDGKGPWSAGQMMTSGPGVLRRAAFQIDGAPAYALEDDRGYPRMYVIAQPGLNLEPFINRRVELFGPMVNRTELTLRGYMAVKTLHILR